MLTPQFLTQQDILQKHNYQLKKLYNPSVLIKTQ